MMIAHLVKRNNVNCISIEEKLGIHEATCVMEYNGAIGYLVEKRIVD